jgi:tRNA(adenine34) deaminase
MLNIFTDEYFMKQAYLEAELAFEKGEVPVGGVVVCQNKIIARGHNLTEQLTDVTAHAELMCITAAAEYLGSKYLNECTLFVTLEPCTMCAGALAWAQLGRLVYGAGDEKRGFSRYAERVLHPRTMVSHGILEEACGKLVKQFFQNRRPSSGGTI